MTNFRHKLLRAVTDDSGADALRRYFAQIEYTAYWCVRLLRSDEVLDAVVPEAYEDVVLVRPNCYELHQVKTRDEKSGPWCISDIHPIFAKIYAHGMDFDKPCKYSFVSNQVADTKTSFVGTGLGPLCSLKLLLESRRLHPPWSSIEQDEYDTHLQKLSPVLINGIPVPTPLSAADIDVLLRDTSIDTNSVLIHYPNGRYAYSPSNLHELDSALALRFPGSSSRPLFALKNAYGRLLELINSRIRLDQTFEDRSIRDSDVLACLAPASPSTDDDIAAMDAAPGETILDKKAHLAGFDSTRRQNMHRQRSGAQMLKRRLPSGDLQAQLESLAVALLDRQISVRHIVASTHPQTAEMGEAILKELRPALVPLAREYFPTRSDVDEQVCLGLLWEDTGVCRAKWHWKAGGVSAT